MAHYPDARKPGPKEVPRIERDDFPAPPFPYTDPERRRRWSESSKEHDNQESADGVVADLDSPVEEDERLKKEADELSKISTGIGKVFLASIKVTIVMQMQRWLMNRNRHAWPRSGAREDACVAAGAHGPAVGVTQSVGQNRTSPTTPLR